MNRHHRLGRRRRASLWAKWSWRQYAALCSVFRGRVGVRRSEVTRLVTGSQSLLMKAAECRVYVVENSE